MRGFLKAWLPVIVWVIVIFAGSTDLLSGAQTSRFLGPFLRWLDPHMSYHTMETIFIVVRKAGHVTEYAILAILLWRAFRQGTPWQLNLSILFLVVSVACALFAVSDEFHQSFVPSRTPSARDVLIDIAGALIGIGIYSAFTRRKPAPAFARMADSSEDRHPQIRKPGA
jgi:VanZ family protein